MTQENHVMSIQHLISQCRPTSPADNNNGEYTLDNQQHLTGTRKESHPHSGTYILRALRAEDPLHFIRRLHQGTADGDSASEELMTIIRSTSAETDDADNKKERNLSLITMALVKQFSEGKCLNKDSDQDEEKPLASSPLMKPDVHNDESETKTTVEPVAPSTVVKPAANIDKYDVTKPDVEIVADETDKLDDVTKPDVETVADETDKLNDVTKPDVEKASDESVKRCDVIKPDKLDDVTVEDSHCEESKDARDKVLIDTKPIEFEGVSESDEKRPRESSNEDDEACVVPMTTDDDDDKNDSPNEVFADDEDEVTLEEEKSFGQVGELPRLQVYVNNNNNKAKEKANGEPAEALDLNSIPGSDTLNLEAGKQKVLLRQRSSAKRRKPSRSTILRHSSCDDEIFNSQISSHSQGDESPPIVNGHYDVGDDADMGDRHDDSTDGRSPHTIHRPHSDHDTSITQAPRAPFLLPGLAEKTKQPVPLPSDKPSDTEPSVPPWMAEIKQKHRRNRTPPRGESEKLQQEAEPEKPAWMKRETPSSQDSDTPPWLRQTSTEPEPEAKKPVWLRPTNTEAEVTADKPSSFMPKAPPRGEVEKTQEELSNREKPAWLKDVLAKRRKTQDILHSAEEWESAKQQDKRDQSAVQAPVEAPTHKQQDLHKADSVRVKDDKQGAPLKGGQSGGAPSVVDSSSTGKPESEATSSRPGFIHSKSMSPAPSSGTDSEPEPPWKAEVKQRKQKPYLQPKKPDQPLRLGELPDWKKELMEKNKRRGSDTAHPTSSPESATTVPPWQKELAQRRGSKRSSLSSKGSGSDREDEENVPEWARQARQLRRSRIASSGVNNLDESGR